MCVCLKYLANKLFHLKASGVLIPRYFHTSTYLSNYDVAITIGGQNSVGDALSDVVLFNFVSSMFRFSIFCIHLKNNIF